MIRSFIATLVLFAGTGWADMASMRDRLPKLVELKNQGLVGEKLDGTVGTVKDDAGAASVVAAENQDRLSIYQERARQSKVGLPEFLKVMGEERIKKEPSGRFVQDASGSWKRK
jgi:uncharacterized protein